MLTTSAERPKILLKEHAYEAIKQGILGGIYPPGTFISERQMAEKLGMSKTPVRAALERLTEQGFVDTNPQRGVVVRNLSAREISDHYDFRMALETFVVRRLANGMDTAASAMLAANLDRQQMLASAHNVREFVVADVEYHMALAQADGNHEIIGAMQRQTDKLHLVINAILGTNSALLMKSLAAHRSVLEQIQKGDGDAAAACMTEHLASSKLFLLLGGRPTAQQ